MNPILLDDNGLTPTTIPWATVKLLILDVDGVLSDGQLYFSDQQQELKAFHVQDGMGIRLLMRCGVQIAVITSRSSPLVQWRMQSLGVEHIYQGVHAKLPIYQQLITTLKISPHEVAYMGDDWPDLPILTRVGVPIAVANAVSAVLEHSCCRTTLAGGHGAVREVAERIMKAKGCYERELKRYLDGDV